MTAKRSDDTRCDIRCVKWTSVQIAYVKLINSFPFVIVIIWNIFSRAVNFCNINMLNSHAESLLALLNQEVNSFC